MANPDNHISICVCTYKRPSLLHHLIDELKAQRTDRLFSYSLIVVDNDAWGSARATVQAVGKAAPFPIEYHIESERNISLARNRSVENARGNMIAFIDDDEFPEADWLIHLFRTLSESGASGILGPVRSHFEAPPPEWLVKSRLLERPEFATGQILDNSHFTRTGNVLFRRSIFESREDRFDPAYGRIGGGDAVFFKRMISKGHIFVWCNEAVVYETILPERQVKSYYIKRALTRGVGEAKQAPFLSLSTLRSLIAVSLYGLLLPIMLLVGQPLFMRYLVKECDHLSKVLAYAGIRLVKERPYGAARSVFSGRTPRSGNPQ